MRRSSPRPVSRGLLPLCPLLIVAPSAPCRPEVYLLPKQRDEQVAKLHFRAFWEQEFMALVKTQVKTLDFKLWISRGIMVL